MRTFDTGATRNDDSQKYDYEGFLSPRVIERFGKYMHKHRHLENGNLRTSDNWQKGIPKDQYMKSELRHVMDLWLQHRGYIGTEDIEDVLCAILFNTQGYLLEILKEKDQRGEDPPDIPPEDDDPSKGWHIHEGC